MGTTDTTRERQPAMTTTHSDRDLTTSELVDLAEKHVARIRALNAEMERRTTEPEREAETAVQAALPHILARVEVTDERIVAWEAVAKHPALKPCYDEERALLPAVLDRLTNLADLEQAVNEVAPARVKPSRDEAADAVLALWPGKTEQEVRGKIAAEMEARANTHIELALRFGGYHQGMRSGLQEAARIARGGEGR